MSHLPKLIRRLGKVWYKVVSGDGCQKIIDKYKTFTLAQFYSWNPDVGTDCAGLPLGAYVCVGVTGTPTTPPATTPTPTTDPSKPSPTQPNVIKTCKSLLYTSYSNVVY